jgi:hypothetical protein
MQTGPGAAPTNLARVGSGAERAAVFAFAAVSAAFVVVDTLGVRDAALDSAGRLDLGIELAARVLMLVLAVFAAVRTQSDPEVRLLVWAVLLVSLDTYWQTTWIHLGGRPLEWTEMVVKYVAVGLGLGLLLRLCSRFGDAPPMRFRSFLHDWSFAIGAALSAVGLLHGVLYIQHCHFFDSATALCVRDVLDRATPLSTNAYLTVDAVIRLAIVAAAVIGYQRSTLAYKQRTMLVAYFSVWFALGTAIDFLARQHLPDAALIFLQVGDAVTTLLFPLGLLYAATRKRLFDVEYVVKVTTSFSLSGVVVVLLIAGIETFLEELWRLSHEHWLTPLDRHPTVFEAVSYSVVTIQFCAGVSFVLVWRPCEKWLEKMLNRTMPERTERIDRLRELIKKIPYITSLGELRKELHDGLTHAVSAKFADIFLHDGKAGFGAYLSNRVPEPLYLREDEPPLTKIARSGDVCLSCQDGKVPDAELAVHMPVRGRPYGVLICGAPLHEIIHFARDEREHLKEFAAAAGSALFAFGAKLRAEPAFRSGGAQKTTRKKQAAVTNSPPQEAL